MIQNKSPFRRCVDCLSQKKFDDREYSEIDKVLCGEENKQFNWDIIGISNQEK